MVVLHCRIIFSCNSWLLLSLLALAHLYQALNSSSESKKWTLDPYFHFEGESLRAKCSKQSMRKVNILLGVTKNVCCEQLNKRTMAMLQCFGIFSFSANLWCMFECQQMMSMHLDTLLTLWTIFRLVYCGGDPWHVAWISLTQKFMFVPTLAQQN